jgi:putative transposase
LRAKAAKKFKASTSSNPDLPVAPNLFDQYFTATAQHQKYVGDITCLCSRRTLLGVQPVFSGYNG